MNKQKLIVILILLPVVCSLFFSVGSVSAYDLELDDYAHYKVIAYEAGVGAGMDYQVVIVVHYGTGTDGTMSLNGETVALLHVGDIQADFDDVRFANQFGELLTFKRCSYTSAVNATFVVKVEANLDVDQLVYVYFGNLGAVDASSNNALIDVIGNVVLALPMNEGAGEPQDFSGNNLDGTIDGATWVNAGKYGNALQFDGTNDRVTVASNALLNFAGSFAVVCTAKMTEQGTDHNHNLVSKYDMAVAGSGYFFGYGWTNDVTMCVAKAWAVDSESQTHVGWGAFSTLGGIYTNATSIQVFVNGVALAVAKATSQQVDGNTNDLTVGSINAGDYFKGTNENVLIFSSAPTVSQMNNLTSLSNKGDATLEAGKVFVRKWATTTLPAVAGVSDVVDNVAFSPVVDGALTDTEWFISGLLLVLALANVVLLAFPFALLRFVFGVLSFALSAWAFTYSGLPLAPYLQVMGLVVSVVCMFLATRARE